MSTSLKNPGKITFEGIIQQSEDSGAAGFVEFPFDLKETYGKGNLVPVLLEFDGEPYRGSIAKMGPKALLLIKKEIMGRLGKSRGDKVKVSVKLDTSPRVVEIPDYIASLLAKNPREKKVFDRMAYTHQKEYVNWIVEAKREETRNSRLEKFILELRNKTS